MAQDERVETAVTKLVQIFPNFDESRIRDVLNYYWNSGFDIPKSLRRSIAWLQISNQLDLLPVSRPNPSTGVLLNPDLYPKTLSPWESLVERVSNQFPLVSTVLIESVLQDFWVRIKDYDQILIMALKDPRLTGNPRSESYGLPDYDSPSQAVRLPTGRVLIREKQ